MSILDAVTHRVDWGKRDLGRVAQRIQASGRPDLQALSVFLDEGVVPRSSREDNHNRLGEDLGKYLVVRPGDIVFNKLRTWQGGLGVSRYDGIVSPAYFVCRPDESTYLHYLLRSVPYLQELTRISKWMPPSQFDITWEQLRRLPIVTPPIAVQRAIADYLDAETARIDALIEKKQQMRDLLAEHFAALAELVVWSDVTSAGPLMYRTDQLRPIMYGIVLPGPDVPDGVSIVKGGDIAARRLSPDRLCRTTKEIEAPYARARLRPSDLVFAIRGGIGDVELVPSDLAGANMTQDAARIAPALDVLPEWLRVVLRTATVKKQVAERVTGATVKGLNIWDLKRINVPASDITRQEHDLSVLMTEEQRVQDLAASLLRQCDLLTERRQALITAAVIGEIDIPGVAA
jgi:type I restriction enzyme S subunit